MKLRPIPICIGLSLLAHGGLLALPVDHPAPPRIAASRVEIGLVAATRQPEFSRPQAAQSSASEAEKARARRVSRPILPAVQPRPPVPLPPVATAAAVVYAATAEPDRPQPPTLPDPVVETQARAGSAAAAAPSQPTRAAAPLYALNPPPVYPDLARRNGWSGEVLVRVAVAASGEVTSTGLETTSGHQVLDRAALDAVRRWRFVPARQGSRPLPGEVLVPVRFRLAAGSR